MAPYPFSQNNLPTMMMRGVIGLVVYHPRLVLLLWVLTAGLLAGLAWYCSPFLPPDTGDFLPEHSPTVEGYHLLREAFREQVAESSIVLAFCREVPFDKAQRHLARQLEVGLERLRQQRPDLGLARWWTWNHPLVGSRLLSQDQRCGLAIVDLRWPFIHDQATEAVCAVEKLARELLQTHQHLPENLPPIQLKVTGTAGFGRDLNVAVYHSLDITTWATVGLVLGLLVLLYRDVCVALVPLVTIGTAVWVSLQLLVVLSAILGKPLINIARIFVVVVLFGAGTDYCLFLLSRFREESSQYSFQQAMQVTLQHIGGALIASAGVVIFGLAMMAFAEFARVSAVGPYVAVSLGVALLAALTLAPALLLELTSWRQRLFQRRAKASYAGHENMSRFWRTVGWMLARCPGTVLLCSVLVSSPLAWCGLTSRAVSDVCAELAPQAECRQGLEIIRQHFPAGEIGPLTVLLIAPPDASLESLRQQLDTLTQQLSQIENVHEVRSLVRPLGRSLVSANAESNASRKAFLPYGLHWIADQLASAHYVRRLPDKWVMRLEVVFGTEPFSAGSMATLQQVRRTLASTVGTGQLFSRYALYGITTFAADLKQVYESDRWRVNSLVLAGILLILVAVVRNLGWACYLLASVLFNYFVTLGLVSLIGPFWLGTPLATTDWKVPYFLFVILVAVGEDYNIFLMSRVQEEQRRLGWCAGVLHALSQTGATISICGLVMAGAFATMMLSELITLAHLGLALALGVLLETFVVRPVLVPAALLFWYQTKFRFSAPTTVQANESSGVVGPPEINAKPVQSVRQSA